MGGAFDLPTQVTIKAIIAVGEYILENGPVVRTQEIGKLYLEQKSLTRKQLSIEYYEL